MRWVSLRWWSAGLLLVTLAGCGGGSRTPGLSVTGDSQAGPDGGVVTDGSGADLSGTDHSVGDSVAPTDDAAGDLAGADADLLPDQDAVATGCEGMPPSFVGGLCTAFCDQLETFDLNDLFSPPASCHADCIQLLDDHPDWLANVICVTAMEQHYFFGNCWWPKPLPALSGCPGWCDEVLGCGLETVLHLPADACVCEAACNGLFAMTGESAGPLLACSTDVLADSCDLGAMEECYQMPLNCEGVCDGFAAECEPGQDLSTLFDDDNACVDLCQSMSQGQLFGLQVCIAVAGCENAERCDDFPGEPFAECTAYCEAYSEVCPAGTIPPDFCPWACTGAAMAIPGADLAQGAQCLHEAAVCPGEDGQLFVGCLSGPCTLMCHGVPGNCAPGSAYFELYPTPEECELACQELSSFQAEAATMCLLLAGCDAPEMCQEPPPAPVAGCDSYCEGLTALCPDLGWFTTLACSAVCTGLGMVLPNGDPGGAKECFEALGTCPDPADQAIFGCFTGKCGGVCSHFDQCAADSAYALQFESVNACREECSLLDWDSAMALQWCLSWGACDNTPACLDLPSEPPNGCDTYCETVTGLCPDASFAATGGCESVCTGVSQAFDAAQPWDADECFDEYAFCPEDVSEIIYGCMIDSDSDCIGACEKLGDCDLTVDWVCEIFCTELEQDNQSFQEWFVDCVDDAGNCQEMAACVGE